MNRNMTKLDILIAVGENGGVENIINLKKEERWRTSIKR